MLNRVTLSLSKGDTVSYFDRLSMTPVNRCATRNVFLKKF
jgi:hypothetical protein